MSSMMFRREFVNLVLTPPDRDLRLFVDFYLSTFASLLTGAIAVHAALYAYRMHGLNKHSNGSVLRRHLQLLDDELDAETRRHSARGLRGP